MHGPIHGPFRSNKTGDQCSQTAVQVGKSLKDLVELVGIEPTTSSLRTMRSAVLYA